MRAFLSSLKRNRKSNFTVVEYLLFVTMLIPIADAGASTILHKLQ